MEANTRRNKKRLRSSARPFEQRKLAAMWPRRRALFFWHVLLDLLSVGLPESVVRGALADTLFASNGGKVLLFGNLSAFFKEVAVLKEVAGIFLDRRMLVHLSLSAAHVLPNKVCPPPPSKKENVVFREAQKQGEFGGKTRKI